jgi:nitrogen-specific signal transduction histidine kinase
MRASRQNKAVWSRKSGYFQTFLDRLLNSASRHNAGLLLLMVCFGVAVVGVFVVRDLQVASTDAQKMYSGSVHGLQQIGELQYYAQETRRATLYALTTSDSNLQVEYADQSRDADQRVKDGIAEYGRQAKSPAEVALASRLSHDWSNYLNVRDEVLASILEGSTKEAVGLDLSGGVPAFELVRQDLNQVKLLYDEDASQRLAHLVASSRRSSWRLAEILGFTFFLSCGAVWAIQRAQMLSSIQLAKLQMEFVASVSHELRTPLAVISSAADNIADGLVEEKGALRRYGSILQKQSRSMGRLVDEILLFASTEDGKNRYVLQPLQVSKIIDSVVTSTEGFVQSAGFVIDRQIEPDLPLVLGELAGISRCLENLIGNAVKYGGDHRRIVLRAFSSSTERGFGREVRLSVTDRGIGIEASEITQIFDPFFRSPRVTAAQVHGTGLGLSLAKRIAEAMGGRLSVISELNAGSTFTLHLQIAKGEELRPVTASPRPSPSLRQ